MSIVSLSEVYEDRDDEEIDISDNPEITKIALKHILDSNSLASRRQYLYISGRYCIPQSVVKVIIDDKKTTKELYRDNFSFYARGTGVLGLKLLEIVKKPQPDTLFLQ